MFKPGPDTDFRQIVRAHEAIIKGVPAQRLWRQPGGGMAGAAWAPGNRRGLDRRVLATLIVVPMAFTGVWVGLQYGKIKHRSGRTGGLLSPPVNEFLDRSDPVIPAGRRQRRSPG